MADQSRCVLDDFSWSQMKPNRILELDGLRGLAALAVLMFHYTYRYQELYGFTSESPFLFRLGYLGVPLFFIVSGFVIFMTVERTEKPLDFVFSRFSRLYPTFWAGVLTTTLIVFVSKLSDQNGDLLVRSPFEVAINLTMLQEFFGVKPVEGVYWTLTRELLFYGLVLILFSVGLVKHWLPLAYAWLSLQAIANLSKYFTGWFPWKVEFYLLTEYCHLFVAGIVFYQLYKGRGSRAVYGLLLFATANQFMLFERDLPASRFEESIYVTLFFAAMLAVTHGKARFFAAKPLVFLGSISYALYLVHQFLGYSIIRAFEAKGWSIVGAIGISSLASVAIATFITWYVEQPSLRFLRRSYRDWKEAGKNVSPVVVTSNVAEVPEEDAELAQDQRLDVHSGSPVPRRRTTQVTKADRAND